MAKEQRTDKEREQELCGGCDTLDTEYGCECAVVSCSECGCRDNLFNMHHPLFHTNYWFDGMPFYEKMSEIRCNDCENMVEEEDDSNEEDYCV